MKERGRRKGLTPYVFTGLCSVAAMVGCLTANEIQNRRHVPAGQQPAIDNGLTITMDRRDLPNAAHISLIKEGPCEQLPGGNRRFVQRTFMRFYRVGLRPRLIYISSDVVRRCEPGTQKAIEHPIFFPDMRKFEI